MQTSASNEDEDNACAATISASGGGSSNSGAKYKLMSPAQLPISRSASLTVPPGFSPTSFLESPVLLSNIKAEPSPTTGSFFKQHQMHQSSPVTAFSFATSNSISQTSDDGFEFQIHAGAGSTSGLSSTAPSNSTGLKQLQRDKIRQEYNQYLARSVVPVTLSKSEMSAPKKPGPSVHVSTHAPFVNAASASEPELSKSEMSAPKKSGSSVHVSTHSSFVSAASASEPEELTTKDQQSSCNQVPHSHPRDAIFSSTSERSSGDGYNWRKYGQKLVKGCEFPRSYYKCTHPNCEVKKIFESSPDGHITEIVYKGSHDHPRPQPSRRFTPGAPMSIQEEKVDKDSSLIGQEDKFNRGQPSSSDPNFMNAQSPRQAADDGPEGADDIDKEDPSSRKRRIDDSIDITPIIKPIREPRVVVQTLSEVDVLDDGYRWRKYGQKVVRGNPNPRSYYKCTYAACPVRKHVERASHDPKAVITTYEGKHNHDVPTARSSHHELSGTPPINGLSRTTSRDNDSMCLNLEVGINRDTESRMNGQLMGTGNVQSQISMASSGMMGAQTGQLSVLLGQQHPKFLNAMGL